MASGEETLHRKKLVKMYQSPLGGMQIVTPVTVLIRTHFTLVMLLRACAIELNYPSSLLREIDGVE